MELLVPLFMLGFFIVAFVLGSKHKKKLREEWQQVAQEYGLTYDGHQIQGRLTSGREVRVWTESRGTQKNKQTYTCGAIRIGSLPTSLHMTREGFLHKAGKLLGMQDHQAGDADFDRMFMIRGDANDIEEPLKNESFRNTMMEVWTEPLMTVRNQEISIDTTGHFSGQRVHSLIQQLDAIGARVEDALITEVW